MSMHIPGEPYAAAASRHQAESDDRAASERAHEIKLGKLMRMTVSGLMEELGPKDRQHLTEILDLHAADWSH